LHSYRSSGSFTTVKAYAASLAISWQPALPHIAPEPRIGCSRYGSTKPKVLGWEGLGRAGQAICHAGGRGFESASSPPLGDGAQLRPRPIGACLDEREPASRAARSACRSRGTGPPVHRRCSLVRDDPATEGQVGRTTGLPTPSRFEESGRGTPTALPCGLRAGVAQSVEHRSRKAGVVGSSPTSGSRALCCPRWQHRLGASWAHKGSKSVHPCPATTRPKAVLSSDFACGSAITRRPVHRYE
jgi:hypothetical protein